MDKNDVTVGEVGPLEVKVSDYRHYDRYVRDLLELEQEPVCCWKTKRRRCLTICSLISLVSLGLCVFFLFPRKFKIENMKEIRDMANQTEINDVFDISGINLPVRIRNDNFYAIAISGFDLENTLPDFPIDSFQIRLSATDPSAIVKIAAHSSAVYNLNLQGKFSKSAGISVTLQCGGNPEASYLSNAKGSVTIDSILKSGTLSLDAENADASCELIAAND